jgi:virginiamycin B lyase
VTEIPSGAGAVRNMDYFEPAGEIWFGTDMNTIGRAKVH